jgi:hypothetical protein
MGAVDFAGDPNIRDFQGGEAIADVRFGAWCPNDGDFDR